MPSYTQSISHRFIAFGLSSLAQSILLMNRIKNSAKGGQPSPFKFNLLVLPL